MIDSTSTEAADSLTSAHRDNLRVVVMVGSIAPEYFGLAYVAAHSAAALTHAGVDVFLASVDSPSDAERVCDEVGFPREKYIGGAPSGPPRLRYSSTLKQALSQIADTGRTVVHLHGLWTYVSYVAGVMSERWRCPLVVSPHGSLEPYALRISPGKKALASLLYERRNLLQASSLLALSRQEEASMRAYGYRGRIEIVPNGVAEAMGCTPEEIDGFYRRHNLPVGSRVILYLARVTPKKNLPLLLRAFACNAASFPGWTLVVAGSDEGGYLAEIQGLIESLGIGSSVRLLGQVAGEEKACVLAAASLFALPSHSEGLPIAVLEAMEYGKPVLTTDTWAFPFQEAERSGWRVPPEEGAFTAALAEAMGSTDEQLAALGAQGRRFVRSHFSWPRVAARLSALYASLLPQTPKVVQ